MKLSRAMTEIDEVAKKSDKRAATIEAERDEAKQGCQHLREEYAPSMQTCTCTEKRIACHIP